MQKRIAKKKRRSNVSWRAMGTVSMATKRRLSGCFGLSSEMAAYLAYEILSKHGLNRFWRQPALCWFAWQLCAQNGFATVFQQVAVSAILAMDKL
ncbi:hypothetical protein NPIL_28281 [Nephila pilipes]|uniref:Uncharacterized protein n=1 Tax=Nephila pilipes TaxID=299642 RepID=A0A8X6U2D2_NEPPI|nr:hypothetical protein NPIL_28281 [Nephila pilipes]